MAPQVGRSFEAPPRGPSLALLRGRWADLAVVRRIVPVSGAAEERRSATEGSGLTPRSCMWSSWSYFAYVVGTGCRGTGLASWPQLVATGEVGDGRNRSSVSPAAVRTRRCTVLLGHRHCVEGLGQRAGSGSPSRRIEFAVPCSMPIFRNRVHFGDEQVVAWVTGSGRLIGPRRGVQPAQSSSCMPSSDRVDRVRVHDARPERELLGATPASPLQPQVLSWYSSLTAASS